MSIHQTIEPQNKHLKQNHDKVGGREISSHRYSWGIPMCPLAPDRTVTKRIIKDIDLNSTIH